MYLRLTRHVSLSCAVLLGALVFGMSPAVACRYLEMELMRLRTGGVSASEASRLAIVTERLVRDGCIKGKARRIAPAPVARAPVLRLRKSAPSGTAKVRRSRESVVDPVQTASIPVPKGAFRTLCVRSCDGYYFPISFSTTREGIEDDAAACSRICPAGDAELYFHATLRERPSDMRSLAGAMYTDLPTAFRHQSVYDPSCTCGSADGRDRITAALARAEPVPAEWSSRPPARVTAGLDPEALADQRGGLSLNHVIADFSSAPVDQLTEVRLIGQADETVTLLTPLR